MAEAADKTVKKKPQAANAAKTAVGAAKPRATAGKAAVTPKVAKAPKVAVAKTEAPEKVAESGAVGVVRLKDFVERVAVQGNLKRQEARQHVDTVLHQLAHAMETGEELNLAGFGRFKPMKRLDKPNGPVLTLKLFRRSGENLKKDGASPLAED